jgi:hypothetical protein
MIVVVPFFSGDAWLAEKNIRWAIELDGKVSNECLLAFDTKTDPKNVVDAAGKYFSRVHTFSYDRPLHNDWPWPQNNAFGNVHRYIPTKFKCPWFWWETDSTPLVPGWIKTLQDEYYRGKRPFGGHWNPTAKMFNGLAIYPNNVSAYSMRAATCDLVEAKVTPQNPHYQPPWDAYCSEEVHKNLHIMNRIMQHVWNLDGKDITFPDAESVERIVRKDVVLFHRVKDGTLIDRMRDVKAGKITINRGEPIPDTLVHVYGPRDIQIKQEEHKSCVCACAGSCLPGSAESAVVGTPTVQAAPKKRGRPRRQCGVPIGDDRRCQPNPGNTQDNWRSAK